VVIAQGEATPIEKCAELARISGYEKQDCWRFLKGCGVGRPPNRRRNRTKWLAEAALIAERKANPAALCAELMRISGNGKKGVLAVSGTTRHQPARICDENELL